MCFDKDSFPYDFDKEKTWVLLTKIKTHQLIFINDSVLSQYSYINDASMSTESFDFEVQMNCCLKKEWIVDLIERYDAVPELYDSILTLEIEDTNKAQLPYDKLLKKLNNLHTTNPTDIENALDAMLRNLVSDKKSNDEDITKIDGKYTKVINHGKIWRTRFTRGVGHEVQSVRHAIAISNNERNKKWQIGCSLRE